MQHFFASFPERGNITSKRLPYGVNINGAVCVDIVTTESSDKEFLHNIARDEVLLYRNA